MEELSHFNSLFQEDVDPHLPSIEKIKEMHFIIVEDKKYDPMEDEPFGDR